MPDAMDRFLTVNDSSGSLSRTGPQNASPLDDPTDLNAPPEEFDITATVPPSSQGPCLYFGPQGQRCARPALEGGFCAQHGPGTTKKAGGRRGLPQIVGAGIG